MVSVGGDRGARWALMGGVELRWQVLVALGEPGVGVTTGCMVLPAHYTYTGLFKVQLEDTGTCSAPLLRESPSDANCLLLLC